MSGNVSANSNSRKWLIKLVTKAIYNWNLIEDGDRILIACSGGKDSTSLAYALSAVRKVIGKRYELEAIHISSDFCSCCKKSVLADKLQSWGIPFTDIYVPIIGRLKPGRKMNCYWCSTQRRIELLNYAIAHGFNKIALGHHMDDIIETFFMNMIQKGQLSTMPVKLEYRKYPLVLIRPLAYLEEREIIAFASDENILKAACTCPFGCNSERKVVRSQIQILTKNSKNAKRRILAALSTGQKNLLIEKKIPEEILESAIITSIE